MKKKTKIIIGIASVILALFLIVYIVDVRHLGKEEANRQWGSNISSFRLHKLLPYKWQVGLGFEQQAKIVDE